MTEYRPSLEEIHQFLESLPTNEGKMEVERSSGELQRRAPDGKAFELSGQFWDGTSDPGLLPQPSKALLLANHQQQYDWLLAEFGGDNKKAYKSFREELEEDENNRLIFDDYYDVFIGKWLSVQLIGNSIKARVSSDPIYEYTLGVGEKVNDLDEYTKKFPLRYLNPKKISVNAYQRVASGIIGKCSIKLVDYQEPESTLFVPEQAEPPKLQVIKYDRGIPTSKEYSAYYRGIYDLTGEKRIWFMRMKRAEGTPLSDDPLRDFIFPDLLVYPEKPKILHPDSEPRRFIITPALLKYEERRSPKF